MCDNGDCLDKDMFFFNLHSPIQAICILKFLDMPILEVVNTLCWFLVILIQKSYNLALYILITP